MDCKTCDELFSDYKRSVHLFTKVVLNLAGIRGADFASEQADGLRLKFNDARDTLTAHQHHHHNSLAERAIS
jgi:hypothetical protein